MAIAQTPISPRHRRAPGTRVVCERAPVRAPAGKPDTAHSSTTSTYGVVISGVGVNTQANGRNDVPLPVGSYWLQKGGEPHVTKCISPNECIFFITQPSKFDYVKTPKK